VHLMFARPDIGLSAQALLHLLPPQLPAVVCTLPHLYRYPSPGQLQLQMVRAVSCLVAHNNCGMLWGAAQHAYECSKKEK
jgi:hypothetical protein